MYLDRLKRLYGTPDIKIITGLRRSGKSELLRSFVNYLKESYTDTNIIRIDFGDLKFDSLKNYKSLYDYVQKMYDDSLKNVLIVDEVQLCEKFELAINSFHNSKNYDIYLTGSNAFLLSSDLATLFTGRFIEIPVYPFSFKEYCDYFDIDRDYSENLQDYLNIGGLSGSYVYEDKEDRAAYINDVYKTLIKRDLIDRYNLSDEALLDNLAEFLMDNISNLTNANNISKILNYNFINFKICIFKMHMGGLAGICVSFFKLIRFSPILKTFEILPLYK